MATTSTPLPHGEAFIGVVPGDFRYPVCVCYDGVHDRVLVSDYVNNRVVGYSMKEARITFEIGGLDGTLDHPVGVAYDAIHDRIVVANSGNHRVQVYSSDSSEWLFSIGSLGDQEARLQGPTGLVVDARDGRIAVCDCCNHRIQVFAADGEYLFGIGRSGTIAGHFNYPNSVAIDSQGRLLVCDTSNHRVQVFSPKGELLFVIGQRGALEGQLLAPCGLAIDDYDSILVCDTGNHRLQVFAPDGTFLSALSVSPSRPYMVASTYATPRRLYVTAAADDQVLIIDPTRWYSINWTIDRHHLAPIHVARVIETMTMIRSLEHSSIVSLLPNELLFEIFQYL